MTNRALWEPLLRKLATLSALDEDDREALTALPLTMREVLPNAYLLRERQQPTRCGYIVDGFAMRQKLAANGGRQIVGVLLPGDFTDMQQIWLRQSDHNVQALTRMTIAEVPIGDLRELSFTRRRIGCALWTEALIEASITREMVLNIGRRPAASRIAHLLCEFSSRLVKTGHADRGFELPMTQEQVGDATGLTSVHVNRTLRQLAKDGLISRNGRFVGIADWKALAVVADFDPLYLHQREPGVDGGSF